MTPEQEEILAALRDARERVEAGKRAAAERRKLVAKARGQHIPMKAVEDASGIGRKVISEIEREAGFAPRLPGGGFPEGAQVTGAE
ncbi:hypothetical protein [Nonomuraea basaltis]|uniref:hypothetical protein n=1 Tax=Nonomuraea basaltis TaxID=2495887 RepID=UPI00110C4EAC|nr:hypothetical protein [Nonomuraea basaltis]TMR97565.1 hypothetical protein EJK15_17765 [Nonomuraea basaltis]